MTARSSTQNYPKINIDRGSVIKPCVAANKTATDPFIDKQVPSWKKILHDVWNEGVPFILRYVSNLTVPTNSNTYYTYFIRVVRYIAVLMLHIHSVYLYIYGYFYPYSLLSFDEICDEFSRCPKWSEAVIKAFAWHPNHDRCALAICNDYVYVYEGSYRIRVLRHNHQRKIVDIAWQPSDKETLIVATQTSIIIWRVTDTHISAGQMNFNAENSLRNSNLTYLAPRSHLILKEKKESHVNGIIKTNTNNLNKTANESSLNNITSTSIVPSNINSSTLTTSMNTHLGSNNQNFMIIENIIPPPIVSIQFDKCGEKLYACSPNSSKIAILDINKLFKIKSNNSTNNTTHAQEIERQTNHIKYLRRFGQGITKLAWSPENNRLATATTSIFIRVFEPFRWSCNKWLTQAVIQDMIWSRPTGRILLIATKNEPILYALPFLDSSQPKDVGGNKSLMKALDLGSFGNEEFEEPVGGKVQSFAWDKDGKRLAISFKDNPESILLYRTVETPTIEFHQIGVIQSDNKSTPLLMDFHDNFKDGSLLTICWSDGNCQHVPFSYLQPQHQTFNSVDPSSPKTPRSLTNFFYVSQPSSNQSKSMIRLTKHNQTGSFI